MVRNASGRPGGPDAADADSANGVDEDATDENSSLQTDGEDDLDLYRLTDANIARAEARDVERQRRSTNFNAISSLTN
jgi:hypothetical protein